MQRWRAPTSRLATLALALLLACTSGPAEPTRDPFLTEIEAAEAAIDGGALDDARMRLTSASALATQRGRRSAEQARVQLGLARLNRLTGESRQARHHLGLARFATRASLGNDSLPMANVEVEASLQHQVAKSHEQAVESLAKARRIREAILPRDHPEVVRTLTALGFAHLLARDYPVAVEITEKTLAALARSPASAERTRLVLVNRNRLAWIFARAALPERADEERIHAHEAWAAGSFDTGDTPKARLGLRGLPAQTGQERRQIEAMAKFARDWIDARRIAEKHFSMSALMLATRGRLDRGASAANARKALARDLVTASLSFAPAGARQRHGERYRLPFERSVARRVSTDHLVHSFEKVYLHAVDFEMPPGSSVLCARRGVVARVISGFAPEQATGQGRTGDPTHGDNVNRVVILHSDGTYASYFPLALGLHVWEGMTVEVGELLGQTTRAGSGRPVLHLDVRRNIRSSGKLQGEPVRIAFDGVAVRDGVPLAGHFYGGDKVAQPAAQDYRVH